MAKATEDGTVLPIVLKAENTCIRSGNETFEQLACPLHEVSVMELYF